jgi:nucleoside diphosphate kinase
MLQDVNYTFALVKPEVFRTGRLLAVLQDITSRGCVLRAGRIMRLTPHMAQLFYSEHQGKSFFEELIRFTASGPVTPLLVSYLDGGKPISRWRDEIGPTDASKAPANTIRGKFYVPGSPLRENTVHGSASYTDVLRESRLFFNGFELEAAAHPLELETDHNSQVVERLIKEATTL